MKRTLIVLLMGSLVACTAAQFGGLVTNSLSDDFGFCVLSTIYQLQSFQFLPLMKLGHQLDFHDDLASYFSLILHCLFKYVREMNSNFFHHLESKVGNMHAARVSSFTTLLFPSSLCGQICKIHCKAFY